MKNFLKRAAAFILSAAVLATNAQMLAAEASATTDGDFEVLLDSDFEDGEIDFKLKGTASVKSHDAQHGQSMRISLKSGVSTTFLKEFDAPVTDGILYVGYDHLRTFQGGRCFDVVYDRPSSEVTWQEGNYPSGILWNGTLLTYANNLDVATTYQTAPYGVAPAAESWTHFEYYYDMDNKIVYAYKDGEEWFVTEMIDGLDQITTAGRVCQSNGADSDEYIDNYKIVHFKNGFDKNIIPGALAAPDYAASGLYAKIDSGLLGHNYFAKDLDFDVAVFNSLNSAQKANIRTEVFDTAGKKLYENAEEVEFEANSEKRLKQEFDAPEYGQYKVYIEVTPENSEYAYKIDTRNTLSCIVKAEKQDPLIGTTDHYRAQALGIKEIERKQELFKNVGFSLIREELHQQFARRSPGKYERDADQKYWQETAAKYGFEHMVVLEGEGLPTADDPEKTADFADYVYSMVTEMKGKSTYFEVGNEVNFKAGFNSNELAATNYVHACKTAYEAAKKANPDCEILATALCEYHLDYIEAFLAAGGGKYMDGISFHPYMLQQRPEDGGMYENLLELEKLMEKYDCGDKKLYLTEIAWSDAPGFVSTRQKSAYMLRTVALISHRLDMFLWYSSQRKDYVADLKERYYGFIYTDGYAGDDVPYGAHPSLFPIAHWNSLMTNSSFDKRIEAESDDIRLYKFKTEDGRDVIFAYTTDEERNRNIGLRLGADAAEVRDMDGNPQTVYAKDGVVSVTLGFEPIYIIGSFGDVSLTESKFKLDTALIDVIDGEIAVLELESSVGDGAAVEAELPNGFESVENSGFKNGAARVAFRALGEKADSGKATVRVKDGARLLFEAACDTVYTEPISYTYKISPYNNDRLWIEADFTNHRSTPVKMELEITAPDEILKKDYQIERIEPQSTRRLRINIPLSFASKNKIKLEGNIRTYSKAGDGEQPFETDITPGFVYYTEEKPVIDGVLSDGEWETVHPMIFDPRNGSMDMVVKEKSDLYGKGYLMCDDDYMYFAAEIGDDVLCDDFPPAQVWRNDSVQFGFAQKATFGLGRTVFNFGLSEGKAVFERYSYMATKSAEDMQKLGDTEYSVRYDEKKHKMYYEAKVPWSEIYNTEFDPKTRGSIAFSICINENDGLNVNNSNKMGRGYYEYIEGIGTQPDSGLYRELPILKRK